MLSPYASALNGGARVMMRRDGMPLMIGKVAGRWLMWPAPMSRDEERDAVQHVVEARVESAAYPPGLGRMARACRLFHRELRAWDGRRVPRALLPATRVPTKADAFAAGLAIVELPFVPARQVRIFPAGTTMSTLRRIVVQESETCADGIWVRVIGQMGRDGFLVELPRAAQRGRYVRVNKGDIKEVIG